MVGKQLKAAALVAFLVAIVSTFATAQPSTIPGPGIQLELAAGTFANLDLQEQPGAIVLMHSKVGGTTPPAATMREPMKPAAPVTRTLMFRSCVSVPHLHGDRGRARSIQGRAAP